MKTILQVIALVCLCTLWSVPIQAQTELSVESPLVDVAFSIPAKDVPTVQPKAAQPTLIPQPLTLKHPQNGKCYAFRCRAVAGCDDCGLFWKDRNGDGKINPRKELRCRCKGDPEANCQIQVQEVACKE